MNFGVAFILATFGVIVLIGSILSAVVIWWQRVDPRDDGRWLPQEDENDRRGFEVLPRDMSDE